MNETANSNPTATGHSMVLRTEGLVKRYGKRTVVNDVSINVRQGEIVGLLGPNGAGKTTSFYMTTGLIVPNGGHIYLDDEDITNYPVYKRARAGIGYLPQEASVFRKMSVEDNILSVLEMTKLSRQQQLEKLESLITEFRLGKVRKNMGDQLSGGERRRTEIARCLAIDRAYLLFEGRILFQGNPEELSHNKIVKEKYLGTDFELKKKDFQLIDEQKRAREREEEEKYGRR